MELYKIGSSEFLLHSGIHSINKLKESIKYTKLMNPIFKTIAVWNIKKTNTTLKERLDQKGILIQKK